MVNLAATGSELIEMIYRDGPEIINEYILVERLT